MTAKLEIVHPHTPEGNGEAAHKIGSYTLSLSLLSIPCNLFTAARAESISFNQLHSTCLTRLKQQPMTCPKCNEDVPKDAITKGYEISKGRFVTVTPEELEAQKPSASELLEIAEFVPASQVDPLYFESSFYLAPESAGSKPFALLRAAMVSRGVVAVAKITKNQREQVAFLTPYNDRGMLCYLAYMHDEVRRMNFPELPAVSDKEQEIAGQLVEAMTAEAFEPQKYRDEYRENVMAMLKAKGEGTAAPTVAPKKSAAAATDIMAALQASISAAKAKKAS